MAPKLGTLMFPGESIDDLKTDKNGKTVLGPGLRRTYAAIHIIKAGILQFKEPNEYWIESPEKRVSISLSPGYRFTRSWTWRACLVCHASSLYLYGMLRGLVLS